MEVDIFSVKYVIRRRGLHIRVLFVGVYQLNKCSNNKIYKHLCRKHIFTFVRIGWSAVHLQSTILVGFLMPISQILFCILIKGIDETPLGIFSAGL